MNQNCVKCDTKINDERFHLGYRECVKCSSVEPYSAHVVYPHKTGAYVQPVSSETKKNLDRLDRRAVKVGGKMSAPTNLKEWTMPEPKKQIVSPKPKQKVFTNQVNFSDSYEQCIDTYKKKGYVVTLNYLKQLFKKNKITMTTKNQLVNVLTSIHMLNRKDRKRYFNGYVS
tara:strand:+ start:51 stop:563 length:513 start_codon:yes stop_codon:yes gene_type:complete